MGGGLGRLRWGSLVVVGVVGVAVGFGLGVVVYAGGGSDAAEGGVEGLAVGGVAEGLLGPISSWRNRLRRSWSKVCWPPPAVRM